LCVVNPDELQRLLLGVVRDVVGDRGAIDDGDVTIERPRSREHGDWASSFALQLGKRLGMVPRELASQVAGLLLEQEGIAAADVAGPGFVNIRLDAAAAGALARRIVEEGGLFGRGTLYDGVTIDVEIFDLIFSKS